LGLAVAHGIMETHDGSVTVYSQPGEGTVFTIRLPLTLAISHALVVRTDEEYYALPLPTVEGVLRLSKAEVAAHLGRESAPFDYGGQKYHFQYLATFVGLPPSELPGQDVTIPVVLVRAGEHSTGLVADELVGSREIVVKSVGPQISGIRGISGATILGDGRIVIILDINSIVFPWPGTVGILVVEDGLKACQSCRGRMEILAILVNPDIPAGNGLQRVFIQQRPMNSSGRTKNDHHHPGYFGVLSR
jgi:chemosensory pili system protein ChpA (sensor histidine kinase/response regulator)